jgi:carotenoid 1,2-hydratase
LAARPDPLLPLPGLTSGPPLAPRFDRAVPPDGYAWWYVDALSADGRYGLTLIAFVGSVFSPYYAQRRRHAPADALDHCALNVALYGPDRRRWAMTERGRGAVRRTPGTFQVGPSALHWDGDSLAIEVDEIAVPFPRRVRGRIRVTPACATRNTYALDAEGLHRWSPLAPAARVEVDLHAPELRWQGTGYLDANDGDGPLERSFARWHWSRAAHGDGATVLYDVDRRGGDRFALALQFDAAGGASMLEPPPRVALPSTRWWRMPRTTGSDREAQVLATLEDVPFYARSLVRQQVRGRTLDAFHESLCLDRFDSRWVQVLLPFRMPRVAR